MTDALANAAAAAGLAMLRDVGYAHVYERVAAHVERLIVGLRELADAGVRIWTPDAPERRAGIVAFDAPDQQRMHTSLTKERFHVGYWQQHIRIDPAFYNSAGEIDDVIALIRTHVERAAPA